MNKVIAQATPKVQKLFCTNSGCKSDAFEVEAVAPRVWQIRQHNSAVAQVAAHQPICPRCASTLEQLDEIEALFLEAIAEISR
jgi:Zn finger protein HypA/HybF involved in hydrogenase expression